MAAYWLLVKTSAAKEVEAIGSKADRSRIVSKIGGLASNPRPAGAETLAGYHDRYRVRQGNFRSVYLIDDGRRQVTVFKVGNRRDVYR